MTGNLTLELNELYHEQVEQTLERAVRAYAINTLAELSIRSPVDTGRFRGNWNITEGSADETTINFKDVAAPKDGETFPMPDYNSLGQTAAASYQLGGSIWITNNLPYAQRLNEGWSKQAPANFVEIALKKSENDIQKAVNQGAF